MKKYLLVALNSQYIHTNLAVRYIKKYVEEHNDDPQKTVEVYESNINNQLINIVRDIYEKSPDVVIFSTYIWNREYVFKIIGEMKKIVPGCKIGLGGPEVSYDSEKVLSENPEIDFVVKGEGERGVLKMFSQSFENIGGIYNYPMAHDLDEIPFPYTLEEIMEEKKILYYESSRGCPFSCSYCLSSADRGIKYFSLERVKRDLGIFLQSNIKLIKFVDRTFNINRGRYMEIWDYLIKNYRKGITFHFEVNANIFDKETLELLSRVPEGYFQFEIGVQSVNWETMESINRRNLLDRLSENIRKIPKTIHLHLDLIAGLPYETYNLFQNSFNYVYDLKPEMIQMGFLKILKGTRMEMEVEQYGYSYTDFAPFEVISNRFITFGELVKLKEIERVLDFYYNSEKFQKSLDYIIGNFYNSPFLFFQDIAEYFKEKGYMDIGHKEQSLYNYLLNFYENKKFENRGIFIEYLKFDMLKNGKVSSTPQWLQRKRDEERYNTLIKSKNYVSVREGHKFSDLESFSYNILDGTVGEIDIFFDYKNRSVERV
ncbi:MAG: DUF4080 domain-containing protein [Fusobacteriaceae bacterium]